MRLKDFNKTAIITKDSDISYAELIKNVRHYTQITPMGGQQDVKDTTKVVIFSENRVEWIYAFFSVWENDAIAVPVDASSTDSDLAYILNDCHPTAIWTSLTLVETVRKAMDKAQVNMDILILDDAANMKALHQAKEPTSELHADNRTALIIYTSGTTGSPKGVMLSYGNMRANLYGVCDEVPIFNRERRTLILLPLHHVLPLLGTLVAPLITGGGVAIAPSMTGPDIMDTLCRGKISIFIGVPRLWQMLYSGIKKKIDEKAITRMLFSMCKKAKSRTLSRTIFKAVHQKMGGNIVYCVSGGAALDKEIAEGLKILGFDLLEGYGMTETSPIISFTRPDDIVPGCVGLPLPSVECKLIDGELCAKGPNVMQGYYNRPQETADVIDKNGFIHTGDLASIDEKGRVTITGRKKEIIVLSNGKNVQPNEIEFQLEKYDDKIKECAITDKDDLLVAIIVPQEAWARNRSIEEIEQSLKREVIEPYNRTVENYKKIMRISVYFGDLPRTRMDKLKRFKLKDLIKDNATKPGTVPPPTSLIPESDTFIILRDYIEKEKSITPTPASHIETDLAFDSLDRVSMQGFIEQSFGVSIDAAAMTDFPNLGAMADHIAKKKTKNDVEHTDWQQLFKTSANLKLQLPSTSVSMPIANKTAKGLFKMYNSLTIKGTENIPAKGPFILAANHQSFLDGPLVGTGMSWDQIKDCYFYATEEHVQHPVLRYLASHNNIILMEKRNLKNSILKLSQVLRQGKNVVIFPEGSRTHSGEVGQFRKMFAILAIELNVPILPVVIRGAYEAMPRSQSRIHPHHIDVEYLPLVQPHGTYDTLSKELRDLIASSLGRK